MINIDDTFYGLLPTLLDSKLCNVKYSGGNIIIETIPQYLLRVTTNYRFPGVLTTMLIPKTGYTLLSSYPLGSFASILSNFDIKYYRFINGVADINFTEVIIQDSSLYVLKSELKTTVYPILLPSASTVAGRVSAVIDYPIGWVLSADGIDLHIEHNMNRRVVEVKVFSDSLGVERILFGNAAYSGWYMPHSTTYNEIVIESLATIETDITIQLIFG